MKPLFYQDDYLSDNYTHAIFCGVTSKQLFVGTKNACYEVLLDKTRLLPVFMKELRSLVESEVI